MKPTIYLPSDVATLVLSRCRLIRATSSLRAPDPLTPSPSVSASCG
jgi:hypothetical protein